MAAPAPAAAVAAASITAAVPLDTDKAERKVWIVRVPPYVAKQWHEAIAASAAVDEDDAPHDVLGQVRLEGGVATALLVPPPPPPQPPSGSQGGDDATAAAAAAAAAGQQQQQQPLVLHMNPNRDAVDAVVLSYEPSAVGNVAQARVDGAVHRRYDAAPVRLADGAAAGPAAAIAAGPAAARVSQQQQQPDPSGGDPSAVKREAEGRQRTAAAAQARADGDYLRASRERLAAARQQQQQPGAGGGGGGGGGAPRRLALINDPREVKRLAGGAGDMPMWSRDRHAKISAAAAGALARGGDLKKQQQRVRLGRDELEERLLALFAGQPMWQFMQLQKETDQPIVFLKEVLNDIGQQVRRGPNKDLWQLKQHLRGAAQTAQQQQQEQQQQAAAAAAAATGGAGTSGGGGGGGAS